MKLERVGEALILIGCLMELGFHVTLAVLTEGYYLLPP